MTKDILALSEVVHIRAYYCRKYPIAEENTIELGLGADATVLSGQDPREAMKELEDLVESTVALIMKPKIVALMKDTSPKTPPSTPVKPKPTSEAEPLDPDPQIAEIKSRPQPTTWEEVGKEGKELLYGPKQSDSDMITVHVPVLDTFQWTIEEVNGKRWAKILGGFEPLGEAGVWWKHGVKCWPEVMRKYMETNIEDEEIYPREVLGKKMLLPPSVTEMVILFNKKEEIPVKVIKFILEVQDD